MSRRWGLLIIMLAAVELAVAASVSARRSLLWAGYLLDSRVRGQRDVRARWITSLPLCLLRRFLEAMINATVLRVRE
jgi:hypothetical protein